MTRDRSSGRARARSPAASAGACRSSWQEEPQGHDATRRIVDHRAHPGALALGVFISFRIFAFPDITADGSLTLGAAVAAAPIVRGYSPWAATLASMLAGALAGGTTGVLHTRFKINGLLAGILVATALYSVNLHVMGRSNISLLDARTVSSDLAAVVKRVAGPVESVRLFGREVRFRDAVDLAAVGFLVIALAGLLDAFLRTGLGTAMRATGDNSRMIRAQGVDVGRMITLGLMMSNSLVALSARSWRSTRASPTFRWASA